MGVGILCGVNAEARLHGVDEHLEPFDAVAEALEGFGHRGEEFAGVGLPKCGLADVARAHGPAAREHPLPVDAQVGADGGKELDAGGMPLHVPADRFRVRTGAFRDLAVGQASRDGGQSLMYGGGLHGHEPNTSRVDCQVTTGSYLSTPRTWLRMSCARD